MQICKIQGRTVVALGTFDGCHIGHASVLRNAFYKAKELGIKSVAYTFDASFDKGQELICTLDEKIKAIAKFDIDYVAIESFENVRELSGEEFVNRVLIGELEAAFATCGFNYRFGKGASCDAQDLTKFMENVGGSVQISPKIECNGVAVSSTNIRWKIKNGEVEEITLSAVKVRNWDNSISVVSPYLLLKNSFRNYQPMRRSGCRRISRAVYIDMNSVGFCTAEELEQLKADGFITAEEARGKMINLTLVRRYLTRWLNNHEHVSHDSLTMVRQLKPTNSGLPLELYFFVNDTNWQRYEEIQCDIFDYVYAVIRRFGLSIFQTPAGTDLARAADKE